MPVKAPATLAEAQAAVQALGSGWRCTGQWTLAQVLEHAAQSVDCSMRGFPQPKPAWFRASVGRGAFAMFQRRGRMSHDLAAAIPGAPAVPRDIALPHAVAHLLQSLREFEAWSGPLQPHFAYGALNKAAYTQAHLMHLADHWQEFAQETS